MNLGYAPLNGDQVPDLEKTEEPNRYGIQLYHHVASGADISGKRVLEIGCGRGGGTHYVMRRFKPAEMIGVDYSSQCVKLASQRYRLPGLSFTEGDAEALPFDDDSADAMISVESSHCCANVDKFLSEVLRVLKPGGTLLLADFRDLPEIETFRRQLDNSGMKILRANNISTNVIRALELDTDRKREMFAKLQRSTFKRLEPLAGMKGSRVFEAFRTGKTIHQSFVLQKPE